MVAIFQQHVHYYAYWISFSMSCKTPLFVPNKKLFPYLYFLDYLCFPLSPLVFPGCPVFVCFPFCPLFFFCLSLFPVFALCFPLFSLFLSVFSCYPMFFLFSSQSVFPCSTVIICFLLFPGTLFFSFLLFYPVSLDSPFFSWFTVFFSVFMVSPQKQWIEKRRKTGQNIENKYKTGKNSEEL